MANYRNDPTGNTAAGLVDREISRRRDEIERAAALMLSGTLSAEEESRLLRSFTGIFRGMLIREMQCPEETAKPEPRPSRRRKR